MTETRFNAEANLTEHAVRTPKPTGVALVLSLSCLVLFLGGLFTLASPFLFEGGVAGLRSNYAAMDQQGRGFSLMIDSCYSFGIGVIVTFVASVLGMLVGIASALKSLFGGNRQN